MTAPRVTVCVPVYEGEALVAQTLRSILAQRFEALRVLVSVDASEDRSLEICRGFQDDGRVEVTAQPARLGWVGNCNWLIEQVRTDYFCIVPQDDLIDPDYVRVLHAHLEEHSAAVCAYTDIRLVGKREGRLSQLALRGPLERRLVAFLLGRMSAIGFRGLVARSRLRTPILLRHNAADDMWSDSIWLLDLACAGELHRVEGVRYAKRVHAKSETSRWHARPEQARLEGWVEHCAQCAEIALAAAPDDTARGAVTLAAMARFRQWHPLFTMAIDLAKVAAPVRRGAEQQFHARLGAQRDLGATLAKAKQSAAWPLLAALPGGEGFWHGPRRQAAEAAAQQAHNDGVAAFRAGRREEGISLLERSIALAPHHAPFHSVLGAALLDLGRLEDSVAALLRSLDLDPTGDPAFRWLATAIARIAATTGSAPQPPPAPSSGRSISVVTCSASEERRVRIRSHYEQLLAGRPFELVQITDARSLAEGYNRGFARTSGDIVIFSHDDIEVLSPHFAERLLSRMAHCDLLGVAGTTHLVSPIWIAASWPYIHGCVAHAEPDGGHLVSWYGPPAVAVQGIDGLFFAATRELCRALPFDEASFDGFHLYDLDFSYRAHLAGWRVHACCDLLLLHQSRGRFDADWRRYADRFLEKHEERFPTGRAQPAQSWPAIRIEDRTTVLEYHRRMREAIALVRAWHPLPGS